MEILTAGIEEAPQEDIEDAVEQFEKEEREIYPKAGESLMDFLSRKQEADHEVMLCPRCSAVFDKIAAKAFEESEAKKKQAHAQLIAEEKYQWADEVEAEALAKKGALLQAEEHMKRNVQNRKTFTPPRKVPTNRWVTIASSNPHWRTFEVNRGRSVSPCVGENQLVEEQRELRGKAPMNVAPSKQMVQNPYFRQGGMVMGTHYNYAPRYQGGYDPNGPLSKTQWRRAQRMKRALREGGKSCTLRIDFPTRLKWFRLGR